MESCKPSRWGGSNVALSLTGLLAFAEATGLVALTGLAALIPMVGRRHLERRRKPLLETKSKSKSKQQQAQLTFSVFENCDNSIDRPAVPAWKFSLVDVSRVQFISQ